MGFRLEGERIVLRTLTNSDANSVLDTVDADVLTFNTLPSPYRLSNAVDFIKNAKKCFKKKTYYDLGIELIETGKIIGVIRLMNVNLEYKNAEVGYWIKKEYRSNGFGTEALKLMLDFSFNELKLMRAYARIMHTNTFSKNLVKKFGFVQEGRMRKAVLKKGKWLDGLMYGLLRADYTKKVVLSHCVSEKCTRSNIYK